MQETCECCGGMSKRSFSVNMEGKDHVFDSFECAIQNLAPRCSHCKMTVIGHGVDNDDGLVYCCDHCLTSAKSLISAQS